jgi:hypothetical protein
MALPPLNAGAVNATVNCLYPRVTEESVGASGVVLGVVVVFQTFDSGPTPMLLTALIFT